MKRLPLLSCIIALASLPACSQQQASQPSTPQTAAAPARAIQPTAAEPASVPPATTVAPVAPASAAAASAVTAAIAGGSSEKTTLPFSVYSDAGAADNHFMPTGWMGDFGAIELDDKFPTNPRSGATCIKIAYSGQKTQGSGWAGIYWQHPANNWGNKPEGYDVTGATKLTFWARGEAGSEHINKFKAGGITGEHPDSGTAELTNVVLTTEWRQYTIDLAGKNLSKIAGGFCWATDTAHNPTGMIFYVDDIRYE